MKITIIDYGIRVRGESHQFFVYRETDRYDYRGQRQSEYLTPYGWADSCEKGWYNSKEECEEVLAHFGHVNYEFQDRNGNVEECSAFVIEGAL